MTGTTAGSAADVRPQADGDRFSLELPAEAASIRTGRLFAAAIARHFGAAEETVEDVKLAISEASTNAVKAHKEAATEAPLTLRAVATSSTVTFEIVDAGPGFTAPPPSGSTLTPPGGLYEGSLGLVMIRSLFPDVEIVPNSDAGMTVRFSIDAVPYGADEDVDI